MSKLSDFNANLKIVKKIGVDLAKYTKQRVVETEVLKTKRVAGVSCKPLRLAFEDGQVVEFMFRPNADIDETATNHADFGNFDILRVLVNGREFVTKGDMALNKQQNGRFLITKPLKEIAAFIIKSQPSIDKKEAKKNVTAPNGKGSNSSGGNSPKNNSQKVKSLTEIDKGLDSEILELEAKKSELLKGQQ